MTTYRFGSYFSLGALTATGFVVTAFIILAALRFRILLAMAIPASVMIAGRLLVRCTACGKSAFLYEINSQDSFLGWATNPRLMVPEKICSRCRADLTVQER